MNIQPFIKQWNGKPCETEDPANLDQCFDLAFAYCDWLGVPRGTIRHLNAYQIFTDFNSQTANYFDRIANTPSFVPQTGDIGVYGTAVGSAGHVAIELGGGNTNTHQSFDQNWNFHHYCEIVTHSYNGFLGVLRPKVKAPQVTSTGDEIMTPDQEKNAYEIVLGREPEPTAQLGHRTAWQFIQDSLGELSAQRQQARDDHAAVTTLTQQNQALTAQVHDLGQKLADATQQPVTVQTPNTSDNIVVTRSWFNGLFDKIKNFFKQ